MLPNVAPDAFAVAPEFDCTEELRVEIDDTDETRPVRYTSDVRLILRTKDLASRAGVCREEEYLAVFTNRHYIPELENNHTDFNIEQLEDYKKWLERGNVSEIPTVSNKAKLTKEQIVRLVISRYLIASCIDCKLGGITQGCTSCSKTFNPTDEFIEKINKVLEGS